VRTIVASAVCLVALLAVADARKPEDVFGGKVLVSDAPFPTSAKSEAAFVTALKKHAKDRVLENKDTKEWRVFYAGFFRQPVNDLEVSIRVYDVTGGSRRLVDTFEQYLSSETARAYVSSVTLKRGDGSQGYDPNTKLLLVMENKGRVLAQTQFHILGEARKYKGVVDFSEEETK
jgi:hypothetical protein